MTRAVLSGGPRCCQCGRRATHTVPTHYQGRPLLVDLVCRRCSRGAAEAIPLGWQGRGSGDGPQLADVKGGAA